MKRRRLKSLGLICMIVTIGFETRATGSEFVVSSDGKQAGLSVDSRPGRRDFFGSNDDEAFWTTPRPESPEGNAESTHDHPPDDVRMNDSQRSLPDVTDHGAATVGVGRAPTSLILFPAHRSIVRGTTVDVLGVAEDASGIAWVELSTDGGATWTRATGQAAWCFRWSPASDGEYSLNVRATNVNGFVESSLSGVNVTVDSTPPNAEFISPTNAKQRYADTLIVTGAATDAGSGVERVEVSTDDGSTWNFAVGSSPWSYTWTPPEGGDYTLLARAIDKAGNRQEVGTRIDVTIDSLRFSLPNGRTYPVLWSGQTITASAQITRVDTFVPTFDPTREVVNPGYPVIDGQTITFHTPGEYYLRVNERHALKVLVLTPTEPISSHVLRIFNFCVANMFVSVEDDNAFYSNRPGYLQWWFYGESPARLLCGPTADVFRFITIDALALPTRKVTFPGVTRSGSRIVRSTHNVLEVYLPDVRQWTLFDINAGFVSRWLDAFELVDLARANRSVDKATGQWATEGTIRKLDIPKDTPIPYRAKDYSAYTGRPYSLDELGSTPIRAGWKGEFQFYYSGAAYWGGASRHANLTGTEFLVGEYLFANRHTDRALEKEVISWIGSFGIPVTKVSQRKLSKMLAAGFRDQINAKAWLERIPQP